MGLYRRFGRTGMQVSSLALGTANFGNGTEIDEARRIVAASVDAGINMVDTADSYAGGNSERMTGRIIADLGIRERIVLSTKGYYPMGDGPNDRGNSRMYLRRAVEASLRRLNTDRIDIYYLHRVDFDMAQDESLRTLDDLVSEGKILHYGTTTTPAWYIMESLATADRLGLARPVVEQAPYNLVDRRAENEVLPLCRRYDHAFVCWSSLAGGILAGRYLPEQDLQSTLAAENRTFAYFQERVSPAARRLSVRVADLAAQHGLTAGQLALLWVKEQPGVTAALIGPRIEEHLHPLLAILDRQLTVDAAQALDEINHPGTAVADFYNTSGWMKERIAV